MKQRNSLFLVLSLALSVGLFNGGCYYDNAKDLYPVDTTYVTDTTEIQAYSWSTQVQPIISNTCATSSCHAAGNNAGRQPLATYEQVVSAVESFDLRNRVETGNMPLGGSLSATDKNAIIGWIEQNYPNN